MGRDRDQGFLDLHTEMTISKCDRLSLLCRFVDLPKSVDGLRMAAVVDGPVA
jgi:hypothetical protein